MITRDYIRTKLSQLPLRGKTVMVHSSLKTIGHIEEGPQCFIEELLKALGNDGNLLMLAASREFAKTGIFDIKNTPADTGLLVETFRRMPGVDRSPVPMTSFIAIGPHARDYLKPFDSYLDENSPLMRLLSADGYIMLLGTDYDKCTIYHLSEERLQVEYNEYKVFCGSIIYGDGTVKSGRQRYYVRKSLETKKSVNWVGGLLEATSAVYIEDIGFGKLRLFKARDFDELCLSILRQAPQSFLVATNSCAAKIPME